MTEAWARELGLNVNTMYYKLYKKGMSVEEVFSGK